jgi:hypothetical protein
MGTGQAGSRAPADETDRERRVWVGPDDRGLESEIVAIVEPEYLLVIHVIAADARGWMNYYGAFYAAGQEEGPDRVEPGRHPKTQVLRTLGWTTHAPKVW